MPKIAAKHTPTACPLRIKQVGHAHHRPQRALHEHMWRMSAFVQAMPTPRQEDGARRVLHSPLVAAQVVLAGRLDVGGASGRNVLAGFPCRRRGMLSVASRSISGARASGTSVLKKILAAVSSSTRSSGLHATSPRRALRRRSLPFSHIRAGASWKRLCRRPPRFRFLLFL